MPPAEARITYDLATVVADYPQREQMPSRSILMCTHPRSGSTLLGELLYAAGGMGCPLEYFHGGFRPSFAERWNAPDMASMLQATRRYRTDSAGVFSCKLFWPDIEEMLKELAPELYKHFFETRAADVEPDSYHQLHALMLEWFAQPTFIHLQRQDRIRQAISSWMAVQTKQWRAIPGMINPAETEEPIYDFERIMSMLAYADHCQAHWTRFFIVNKIQPYALSYEDLTQPNGKAVHQLLQYFGYTGPLAPIRMQKQAGARSEQFLARFLRDYQAHQ